jgi:ABC-2 type transport system permease protein
VSQWIVLYSKEMLEMQRNYKWIWVPLVFILLGIMNPIGTYYLPQLLESNGLSNEILKAIPTPTGAEVMLKTLSQYNTLGILILVLSFMGAVASERLSGSAIMVLVKPVPHLSYITAKWVAMLTLTTVSFVSGYIAAWYYTSLLIGDVGFTEIWKSMLVYLLWLLFVIAITLFYSSLLNSTGAIAFVSLLTLAAISLSTLTFTRFMKWSPGQLSTEAGALVTHDLTITSLWSTLSITVILIMLLNYAAAFISKRK